MRAVAVALGLVLSGISGDAHAQPVDWGPKREPFDRGVVARYQAILARDPHDPALAKLAAMYTRYRTLDALIAEYDAKLSDHASRDAVPSGTARRPADDGAVLIVIGRLLEQAKQPKSALSAYHRAWAVRADDPKLALRIAAIERDDHQPDAARVAYERALMGDKAVQREALRGLLALARSRHDRVAQASLAKRLSELDPRDPSLQLDRGDAMLAIDLIDAALEAYATADKLYATDPVRRLDVIARRGLALERRDRVEAEAEYRRGLALVPPDHYLRGELFGRIVELHRRAGTLGGLLALCLDDWPVARRGRFEWYELSKLHDAVGNKPEALASLEQAVRRSQDPRLRLELADRYAGKRTAEALAILDKLAARSPKDISMLSSVAERYAKWGQLARAVDAYDRILKLDPAAADRMIDLVEEKFRGDQHAAAASLAHSVASKLKTGESHARLGKILLEWGRYQDAVTAFGKAISLEPTVADHWRGRAAAHDSLGDIEAAVKDAEQVLRFSGTDPRARRLARKELVRIVLHAPGESGLRARFVDDWREAFERDDKPDLEAGLLLLDYFGVSPCDHWVGMKRSCDGEVVRVVRRLSRYIEIDADDILMLASAYSAAGRHDEAIQLLAVLRELATERTAEIDARIKKIEVWRRTYTNYTRWQSEPIDDPEPEILGHRTRRRHAADAIREPLRLGLRIGYGNGLRGGGDNMMSAGLASAAQLGRNVFLTARLDWSQRAGAVPFQSLGGSIGVAKSLVTTKNTALVLGFAERLERRWGTAGEMDRAGIGATGLSADATLDLVGRNLPASIGARLEQAMSDDARNTALMFELSIEIR